MMLQIITPKLTTPWLSIREISHFCQRMILSIYALYFKTWHRSQLHGVPHGILRDFINVLDENVFQNPQILHRTVGLLPEQTTLVPTLYCTLR
jgi:hypothetical protein